MGFKELLGYSWANPNGANSARQQLKQHFGLPTEVGNDTIEWVYVQDSVNELINPVYYFLDDPTIPPILGGPSLFTVWIQETPNEQPPE